MPGTEPTPTSTKRVSVSVLQDPQSSSRATGNSASALRRNSTPIEVVDSILAEYGSPVKSPKGGIRSNSGGGKSYASSVAGEEGTKSALKKTVSSTTKSGGVNGSPIGQAPSPFAHSESIDRMYSPESVRAFERPPSYRPSSNNNTSKLKRTNTEDQMDGEGSEEAAATNDLFSQFQYGSEPIDIKSAVAYARDERITNDNYHLLQQGLLGGIGAASDGATIAQPSSLKPTFVSSLSAAAPILSTTTAISQPTYGGSTIGTTTTIGNIIAEQRHPLHNVITAGRGAIGTPLPTTPKPEGSAESYDQPSGRGFNGGSIYGANKGSGVGYPGSRPPSSRPFGSGSHGRPHQSVSNNDSFQSIIYQQGSETFPPNPSAGNGAAVQSNGTDSTTTGASSPQQAAAPTALTSNAAAYRSSAPPFIQGRSHSAGGFAASSLLNSEFNPDSPRKPIPHAAADMLDRGRQAIDSMQIPLQYKLSGYAPLHRTVQMLLSALTILAADVRQNSTEVNKLDAKLSSETFKSNHHTAFVKKTLEDYVHTSRLDKLEERINARLDSIMEKLASTSSNVFQNCDILSKRIDSTINDVISVKARLEGIESKNDKATAANNTAQMDVIAANKSDLAAAIHQLSDELKKTKGAVSHANTEYKREMVAQGESIATIQRDLRDHANVTITHSEHIDRINTEFSKKVALIEVDMKNVNTNVAQLTTEQALFSTGLGNDVKNLQREHAAFVDKSENNMSHMHTMIDTRLINLREDIIFTQNEMANTKGSVQQMLKGEKAITSDSISKIESSLNSMNNKISMLTTLQAETEAHIDQSLTSFEASVRTYTKTKVAALSDTVSDVFIISNKQQQQAHETLEKRIVAVGKMVAGIGYLLSPSCTLSTLAALANETSQLASPLFSANTPLVAVTSSAVVQEEIDLVASRISAKSVESVLVADDENKENRQVKRVSSSSSKNAQTSSESYQKSMTSDQLTSNLGNYLADLKEFAQTQLSRLTSGKGLVTVEDEAFQKPQHSSSLLGQPIDPVAALLNTYYSNQKQKQHGDELLYFYHSNPGGAANVPGRKGGVQPPTMASLADVARYKMFSHLEDSLWRRKSLLIVSTKSQAITSSQYASSDILAGTDSPVGIDSAGATFVTPKSSDGEGNEGIIVRVGHSICSLATTKDEISDLLEDKLIGLGLSDEQQEAAKAEAEMKTKQLVVEIVNEKQREFEESEAERRRLSWTESKSKRRDKEVPAPALADGAKFFTGQAISKVEEGFEDVGSTEDHKEPSTPFGVARSNSAFGQWRAERGTLISLLGIEIAENTNTFTGGVGVIVARVLTAGPSYQAGIVDGDLIVAVNHQEVTDVQTFISAIELPTLVHTPYLRLIIRRGDGGSLQSIRVAISR